MRKQSGREKKGKEEWGEGKEPEQGQEGAWGVGGPPQLHQPRGRQTGNQTHTGHCVLLPKNNQTALLK